MTFCHKCSGTFPRPGETFDWPKPCTCPPDLSKDPRMVPVRRSDQKGERKFILDQRLVALEELAAADVSLEKATSAVEAAMLARLEALQKLTEIP